MSVPGTLLPTANATACPQLAKADVRRKLPRGAGRGARVAASFGAALPIRIRRQCETCSESITAGEE